MNKKRMKELKKISLSADVLRAIISKDIFSEDELFVVGTANLSHIRENDFELFKEAENWFFSNLECLVENEKIDAERWIEDRPYGNEGCFSVYRIEEVIYLTNSDQTPKYFWNREGEFSFCYRAFLDTQRKKKTEKTIEIGDWVNDLIFDFEE